MKYKTLLLLLLAVSAGKAQSLVQSVNSGSVVASNTAVSVGEIVVNPVNPAQGSSGLVGILAQINGQFLEVSQFEVSQNVIAYPNPTTASISFEGGQNLVGESVSIYSESGTLVAQKQIGNSKSVDLSHLASGIYLIQFNNSKNRSFKIIKR